MLTSSSKHLISILLKKMHVEVKSLRLGNAVICYDEKQFTIKDINQTLLEYNFSLVQSKEQILIDQIKKAVIDLVYYMNNQNSIVQKSDYLVEILKMSYDKISREFKKNEAITLEKFIIKVKIERIKELLENDTFSLSEIAYMMDYSSIQHLSSQFKKITGLTISEYKKSDMKQRIPLDDL